LGDGGGFRSPMAIAVIGGLVVSTLLSLVFVPAVFTVLDDVGRLMFRLFRWLLTPREARGREEAHGETHDAEEEEQDTRGAAPMPAE
jgi:hypothetical protein